MTAETLERLSVEEMLSAPRHWMLRWGNLTFLALIAVVFGVAALVPYPDAIKGKATIVSNPHPTNAVARTAGALTIFVADGARVAAGEPLAVVETTARLSDVRAVRRRMQSPADPHAVYPPLRIGELQPYYAAFIEAVDRWRDLETDPQARDHEMQLMLEIDAAERQLLADRSQVASLGAKASLTRAFYDRTRALSAAKLVSKQDVELAESALLDSRVAAESGRTAAAISATRVTQYREALADLRHGRATQLEQQRRAADEARQNLLAQLDQWEALRLIAAPRACRVWFLPAAIDGQHVSAEQPLMIMLPEQSRFTARIEVPLYRSGQIVAGQPIVFELSEYPKSEYGSLRGNVTRIAPMPRDDLYVVDAELASESVARIPLLKPGMTGLARIVTHDRSILARMFDRVTSTEAAR